MTAETEPEAPSPETLRLELQQAIETFRHVNTLYVQALGFLITVDSLLVSYGIAQGKAILLLIAASVPLAMFIARKMIMRHVARS